MQYKCFLLTDYIFKPDYNVVFLSLEVFFVFSLINPRISIAHSIEVYSYRVNYHSFFFFFFNEQFPLSFSFSLPLSSALWPSSREFALKCRKQIANTNWIHICVSHVTTPPNPNPELQYDLIHPKNYGMGVLSFNIFAMKR